MCTFFQLIVFDPFLGLENCQMQNEIIVRNYQLNIYPFENIWKLILKINLKREKENNNKYDYSYLGYWIISKSSDFDCCNANLTANSW